MIVGSLGKLKSFSLPSQQKTHFLGDFSEAKTKYRIGSLIPRDATTSTSKMIVVDNVHTRDPMGMHCLKGKSCRFSVEKKSPEQSLRLLDKTSSFHTKILIHVTPNYGFMWINMRKVW